MARDAAVAPAIALHDAAVHLGGRTIWSDLSIEIGTGEFVAILGPNGAGKSTLLKVVLGLLTLTSGTVRVLGLPPGQANERVGYVPQRRNFDPSLRVRGVDIVELGLDGARWWFPVPGATLVSKRARAELARIHAAVDLVGGTHYAHRPIGAVSGGEQQRLLIAQALVRQPAVLILDEPLESLDLPNQTAVSALIQQIAHDHGVTVLMVVHDVNPILPYVDRVVYMAGGRALIGSPNAVINSDTLSNLYSSPVEVLRARDGRLVV
ncbi:MAG: ABC transporter ATP-binding protein, partial [Mycobacterium sp.]|nr:ABC transporter ATP-binding protein [Mycobacterium sp.]